MFQAFNRRLQVIDLSFESFVIVLKFPLARVLGEPFTPGVFELGPELGILPHVVLLFGIEPAEFAVGLDEFTLEGGHLACDFALLPLPVGCEGEPGGRDATPGELPLEVIEELVGLRRVVALVAHHHPVRLVSPFRSVALDESRRGDVRPRLQALLGLARVGAQEEVLPGLLGERAGLRVVVAGGSLHLVQKGRFYSVAYHGPPVGAPLQGHAREVLAPTFGVGQNRGVECDDSCNIATGGRYDVNSDGALRYPAPLPSFPGRRSSAG